MHGEGEGRIGGRRTRRKGARQPLGAMLCVGLAQHGGGGGDPQADKNRLARISQLFTSKSCFQRTPRDLKPYVNLLTYILTAVHSFGPTSQPIGN